MSDKPKVSEAFEQAFGSNCSGCRRTCACGRVHFDFFNDWDWEEGELDQLKRMEAEDKDKCVGHEWSIGTYVVDDVEFVAGCQCESGAKYEKFIIQHARQISRYLNERAERLKKEAAEIQVKTRE